MVALDQLWESRDDVVARRAQVVRALESLLAKKKAYEVIVGRPNTAEAVKKRIDLLVKVIARAARK
jgi:RNase H-fold protein (predicted Holliday junction resolvase)